MQIYPPANGGINAISSPDFSGRSSSVITLLSEISEIVMDNFGEIILNPVPEIIN